MMQPGHQPFWLMIAIALMAAGDVPASRLWQGWLR
jgi:hypothetical protein